MLDSVWATVLPVSSFDARTDPESDLLHMPARRAPGPSTVDDIDDDDIESDDGPPCRPLTRDVAFALVSGPRSETLALAGLCPYLRRAHGSQYSVLSTSVH